MNIDEFPSLDFLLPYTGNKLQTKLLLGGAAVLVFSIVLLFLAVVLVLRVRRNRRSARSTELSVGGGGSGSSSGCGGGGSGIAGVPAGDGNGGLSSSSTVGGGGGGALAGTLGISGVDDMMQSTLIGGGGVGVGSTNVSAAKKATAAAAAEAASDKLMGQAGVGATGPGASYGDVTKMRGVGGFAGNTDSLDGFDTNPDIIPLKGNCNKLSGGDWVGW